MKKWIIGIVLFLILVITILILSSPSGPSAGALGIKTSSDAAYRTLSDQKIWNELAGENFRIRNRLLNTLEISVQNAKQAIPLTLYFVPVMKDSVILSWQLKLPGQQSLTDRLMNYSLSSSVEEKVHAALGNIKNNLQDLKNIYGISINQTSTKDTFLIAKKFTTRQYPGTSEIYKQISLLESYAKENNAIASGFPMLNVTQTDTAQYSCMVALPINKIINDKNELFFVRMVPGQFITTEIVGGPGSIANGHKQIELYFKEFNRTSMAIPFEYLVTNRLKETDTTKWRTQIFAPVY